VHAGVGKTTLADNACAAGPAAEDVAGPRDCHPFGAGLSGMKQTPLSRLRKICNSTLLNPRAGPADTRVKTGRRRRSQSRLIDVGDDTSGFVVTAMEVGARERASRDSCPS